MSAPALQPLPGFDPNLVNWGGPDQVRADKCSYCEAPLSEDEVPLILWRGDGWCAEFCEACQTKHWGFEIYHGEPPDYDEPERGAP